MPGIGCQLLNFAINDAAYPLWKLPVGFQKRRHIANRHACHCITSYILFSASNCLCINGNPSWRKKLLFMHKREYATGGNANWGEATHKESYLCYVRTQWHSVVWAYQKYRTPASVPAANGSTGMSIGVPVVG